MGREEPSNGESDAGRRNKPRFRRENDWSLFFVHRLSFKVLRSNGQIRVNKRMQARPPALCRSLVMMLIFDLPGYAGSQQQPHGSDQRRRTDSWWASWILALHPVGTHPPSLATLVDHVPGAEVGICFKSDTLGVCLAGEVWSHLAKDKSLQSAMQHLWRLFV